MESLALSNVFSLDGSVAIVVRGVVDDDTVEQFEQRVESAVGDGSRQLVLDLTGCRLASAGLAALVRLQRRSSGLATATRLVATVEQLRMLEIVGLSSRFGIYRTLNAALYSARRVPGPFAGASARTGAGGFSRRVEREGRALVYATGTDAAND